MHKTNLVAFKTDLRNVNWNSINHSPETNSKYETFFKIFSELYKKTLSLKGFSNQSKRPPSTMDKQRIEKSSKQKQKLYIKFLKDKSIQNEQIYKNYPSRQLHIQS